MEKDSIISDYIPVKYSNNVDLLNYLQLFFIICIVYFAYYYTAKRMNWEHRDKTLLNHLYELGKFFTIMFFVYYLGNINNTLSMFTIIGLIATPFIYGFVAENPNLKFSLATIKEWTAEQWRSMGIPIALLVGIFGYGIYLSKKYDAVLLNSSIFLASMGILLLSSFLSKKDNLGLHPHHWQIGLVMTLLFRFPDYISNLIQGVGIGMMIQGISAYGVDSMLNVTQQ